MQFSIGGFNGTQVSRLGGGTTSGTYPREGRGAHPMGGSGGPRMESGPRDPKAHFRQNHVGGERNYGNPKNFVRTIRAL